MLLELVLVGPELVGPELVVPALQVASVSLAVVLALVVQGQSLAFVDRSSKIVGNLEPFGIVAYNIEIVRQEQGN